MSVNVLLLTDQSDPDVVLPTLPLVAETVVHAPLGKPSPQQFDGPDVAVVDARTDLPAARQACRKITVAAPQLAVVAVVSPEDFVAVDLEWHVDDVVLPTACTAELQTRLRLAIARRHKAVEDTLQFGDLVLHPASYIASLADRELDLTLTEFKLLSFLVQHAGRAFTRTRLMHEVWGHECGRRTVDVHVQRLRAKLGAEHESIVDTVRGVGYMAPSPPRQVTPKSA
nr:winged helix-turn-helix domain-containing protein [Mycobacterium eburneum]